MNYELHFKQCLFEYLILVAIALPAEFCNALHKQIFVFVDSLGQIFQVRRYYRYQLYQ